jgi:hypothetical protein
VPLAGDFAAPLREIDGISGPPLAVEPLEPGLYRWRMRSIRADGDLGPWGDPEVFELRPEPPPPPKASVTDNGVALAWTGLPGQQFDLQMARERSFEPLLLERRLTETKVELPRPGSGRFWVRLRSIDPDGWVGPFGAPQFFEVPHCLRDASNACVRQAGEPVVTTP